MNRVCFFVVLALVVLGGGLPVGVVRGATFSSRMAVIRAVSESAPLTLPGDPMSVARLYARYGETVRAYQAMGDNPEDGSDPTGEDLRARLLTELGRYEAADSLLALRPHARDPREYYLHHLRRARLNFLSGRDDRALEMLRRLDGLSNEEFDPYRDMLSVDILLRGGRAEEAVDVARRRLAAGIPRSMTPAFESKTLESLVAAGRADEALVFIDSLKTRSSSRSSLAPVIAKETVLRFETGDTVGALSAASDFVRSYGAGRAREPVDAVVSRMRPGLLETAMILDFAEALLAQARLADAKTLLDMLEERRPDPAELERARLIRSEIRYREGRYRDALREAGPAFGDPALERRAKLLRARAYKGAGEKRRSARAYVGFASAYPYDQKAPEALYVAWDMYREAKDPKAEGILDRIVETYPRHRYAHLATRRIALDYLQRREYSKAARVLDQALRKWGRDDEALLYYRAVVYERAGRKGEAKKLIGEIAAVDSFSFYIDPDVPGDLAYSGFGAAANEDAYEESLQGFLECVWERREAARGCLMNEVAPWAADDEFEEAGTYLTRGGAFLEMGFRDWAESELRVVETWKGLPPRALLELSALYEDYAMPSRGVRTVQRVRDSLDDDGRKRVDGCFRFLAYPTPFPLMIAENCRRFGMSPHLVYAMMREESRFDEKAVSGAGARGLMQLMPGTAEPLADALGVSEESSDGLLSPEFNLVLGIAYASDLLSQSNGDPLMMLAAYNGGLSNARRWFGNSRGHASLIERVDAIDYWETCDYVKKIVESAHVYHRLYFSPAGAAKCN